MLKIGDKLAQINKKTNEVWNIFRVEGSNNGFIYLQSTLYCTSIDGKTSLDLPFPNYTDDFCSYEPLTKEHEQRYQKFLYKKDVNEWFANKEFSFEEKESIYISFNAILATENKTNND